MAIVEYVRAVGEGARKRHYHETRRGTVIAFVVQLQVELRGVWVPVVRYDMAHGQAHIDVYETLKRKRKQFLELPPGEVMTLAEEDISVVGDVVDGVDSRNVARSRTWDE